MKILYICDFFHPYAGYHPNVLSKIWSKLGHEVHMLTSEMDKIPTSLTKFFEINDLQEKDKWFEECTGVQIIRVPLVAYVSGRSIYKNNIYKIISEINPDVVYVNGNDTLIGIQLILHYKKNSFGLVMDSHMLEMASSNRWSVVFRKIYKWFVTPIIIKEGIPVIRTQDDSYVEKYLGIPLKKSPWISFGTDMSLFYSDEVNKKKFRVKNNISQNAVVFIYAGKLVASKGGILLSEALKQRFNTKRDIVFLIVGNTEGDSGKLVEESFLSSENTIIRFPTQKYADLPLFYQAADVAVFPKQCSLSFFDVQACSLPVIFEDNSINIDRSKAGNAVTYKINDVEDLRKKIEMFANMEQSELGEYQNNAYVYISENYSCEVKAREYLPYLYAQYEKKHKKQL